jgi:nicotinate-nucleotide pyrophosphorylase (carboxylating)
MIGDPLKSVTARVIAKADGIWAGEGLDQAVIQLAREEGFPIDCKNILRNGEEFQSGQVVTEWSGSAHGLLVFERSYLNLASWTSGIASKTQALVSKVEAAWGALSSKGTRSCPRVTATRKTLPGYRDLSVMAVLAGGGFSHRTSLAGGVLIKENHIASAGGIAAAVEGARACAPHGLRIEVEVTSTKDLEEALGLAVDCVMLDNFRAEEVTAALDLIRRQKSGIFPQVEVSGGIDETNVDPYVQVGVDIISSGSLTHTVRGTDLSMLIHWAS